MKTIEPPRTPLHDAEIWPLSVAAYRALGEAGLIPKNTELLYGLVYKKMSKSPYHSFLVMRLVRLLQAVIPVGCLLRTEQPISCMDSEPEPDLAVVRGAEGDFLDDHPHTAEFVVEVCVTSHDYNRSKIRAYAIAGVKELWLVLAPERQVEIYRKPVDEEFAEKTVHGPGGQIASLALPAFTVELDSLFAK
ncbi:MAG: Uma2 family endonuclease [Verrucomicrobia bacterium]|nr:Uma2 family endonuclease [Verrucomicrobiota bacterium]